MLPNGAFGAADVFAACSLAAFVDLERTKARVARGVVTSKETMRIEREHCVRGRSERRRAELDMVGERSCGQLDLLKLERQLNDEVQYALGLAWTQCPKAELRT